MDVRLRTNDSDCELALCDVIPQDDHPSYGCRLLVRSAGFAADRPFWVERSVVAQFLEQVRAMDRTLTGRALLQPLHEPDRVELELTRTGAVVVSGELGYAPSDNHLKFSFITDQTCLRPLIAELGRLLEIDAPAV